MKPLLEIVEVKQIKERRFYVVLWGRITTMESFMLFFKSSGKKELNICNRNTNIKARLRSRSKN